MEKIDAAWYAKVVAERQERIDDCKKQIEFANNQIDFWTKYWSKEQEWLKECEEALAQALIWEEEYKNENSHL